MITIEVNNRPIRARQDETLLSAMRRAGIDVPTLCNVEHLTPTGACRLCVVEVEGQPGLVPSCAAPVSAGMRVWTHSPRAVRARKTIVELLLANHPDDCLYCVRNKNCELQSLAMELGVAQRRYYTERRSHFADTSSPSIARDPSKCVLCGKCVRICEEIQGISAIDFVNRGSDAHVGTAFDRGLDASSCIDCGQCVMACPTGALSEQSHVKEVMDALARPDRFVVAQFTPTVAVSLAEEFGLKPGVDMGGKITAALRRLGFNRVFDAAFSADLMVIEQAAELVERIRSRSRLPMFTSCSPGWIKYVEQSHPEYVENLSTCKSPQQMMGALIKGYFAEREKIDKAAIFSVSIVSCTAKKFEAGRPEMRRGGLADVDAVLTTREFARIIRQRSLNLSHLDPETADRPFGEHSSAGGLFSVSGGAMEATVRTAHYMLTGQEVGTMRLKSVRGLDGLKLATLRIGDFDLKIAAVSGIANAGRLLDDIRAGKYDLHFVEVMTCPGGCIAGGGQPIGADAEAVKARMQSIYRIDRGAKLQTAHGNGDVKRLYAEFLGEPLSDRSREILHTHYRTHDFVR